MPVNTTGLARTSRQVVFTSKGVLETANQPLPALEPDGLLLNVKLVGVCATDLHLLAGHIGNPFPLVPGHEFVGVVAALGDEAARKRGLTVGDAVAVEMLLPCQSCARCREGRYNLCEADDPAAGTDHGRQLGVNIPRTVSPGLWGGYSEYVSVPREAIVHRLPADLPWKTAVLVEPLAVAYRAIGRARLVPGESVVVIGPGPVGILAAAAARAAGAGRVIVIGTRSSRLALARRFGADLTIDSRQTDAVAAVRAELGSLADAVIEVAGV
ncbi:MAG: alcohol dehydrogenase catalytic domain-containing protein, partial [Leifsonia sp.]